MKTNKFEKIPNQIFISSEEACIQTAKIIRDEIVRKNKENANCVLGLATGSTPIAVYNELVRMHKIEGLSFKNVITFNLDEYFNMKPEKNQSYHSFMYEYLFNHIDIIKENINIPKGDLEENEVGSFCSNYEKKIKEAGGIDIQILGIGRTGHIGFNEPGSSPDSLTRLITLDKVTRMDAASDFFGEEHVPRKAITMGVGSILAAKKVLLMAFGEHKAPIVAKSIEGEISPSVAASYLQTHRDAVFFLDQAASQELTRIKLPWLCDTVDWNEELTKKAVIWLSGQCEKAVLKLTGEDYAEAGLYDLIAQRGSAYEVNLKVFRSLQNTITGWPGGKKKADEIEKKPWYQGPFPKRIIIFSPHPDDDVISMGGTLIRLVSQGHEVHVAYQTSGNIAVFDFDAIRFANFVYQANSLLNIAKTESDTIYHGISKHINNKEPGEIDSKEVSVIKSLIRKTEAIAAGRECGIPEKNLHFLDMPFYETGEVRKKPIGQEDVKIIKNLLAKIQPHQIYAAGDLSDPHGTHRMCLKAVFQAIEELKSESWINNTQVWLYRGAWQEWEPYRVEMAVPLSPEEMDQKRKAIFRHQSQKDRAMFPGPYDKREFWQRAEDRNRATAQLYDQLGLAEYEGIEAFRRYWF